MANVECGMPDSAELIKIGKHSKFAIRKFDISLTLGQYEFSKQIQSIHRR